MRVKRIHTTLYGAILVGVLATTGLHAEVDDAVRQAQALTAGGQPTQAYALLEPMELARAGDPDFDLALGAAANEVGQYTRAILALERVLASQPGNTRARAELGRALYGVGDNKTARALLEEGKMQGITAVAGETIDQLLHAIDRVEAAGRSSFKGYIEASAGHDSNINGAPGFTNVAVPSAGGAVLALAPGGTRQAGSYGSLGGGVSGRVVLEPRWSLIGAVAGTARHYTGGNDQFDTFTVDGNAGLSYRFERNEYTVVGQFGSYDIDHDRVRNLYGLVGEWTYRPDGFRQVNIYLQLTRLKYPMQPISDADRHVVGLTYAHLFRSGFWAFGGVYFGEEAERDSTVPHLGHKMAGLRTGIQYPISPSTAVVATAAYEERHFGGQDQSFQVGRRDEEFNISLGMSWVPAPYWRVSPLLVYSRTRSNVPLAEYDKRAYSVTVRREF